MAISKEVIERINILARKKKAEGLTSEEILEQKKLREEYIREFKTNVKSTLNNIDLVDKLTLSPKEYDYEDVLEKLKMNTAIKKISNTNENIEILYDYKNIDQKKIHEIIKN